MKGRKSSRRGGNCDSDPICLCRPAKVAFIVAVIQHMLMGLSFTFAFSKARLHYRRRNIAKLPNAQMYKILTSLRQSIVLDIDGATELSTGSLQFPPMVSVPCTSTRGKEPILREIVKPPNVEALYEWYCDKKQTPDSDPSWGVLWPTAVSLTNYLLSENHRDRVQNKNVVELGAGLGLCGLAAAALGAKSVTLTDREPYALHCALATAACNEFSPSVVNGAILDWSNPVLPQDSSTSSSSSSFCDVILASDVLYDGETILAFANACEKLIHPKKGGILLLSDPREERFPTARGMLREALVSCGDEHERPIHFEVLDLPPIISSSDIDSASTTMDGRDHEERMKEPTVLILCTFRERGTP